MQATGFKIGSVLALVTCCSDSWTWNQSVESIIWKGRVSGEAHGVWVYLRLPYAGVEGDVTRSLRQQSHPPCPRARIYCVCVCVHCTRKMFADWGKGWLVCMKSSQAGWARGPEPEEDALNNLVILKVHPKRLWGKKEKLPFSYLLNRILVR